MRKVVLVALAVVSILILTLLPDGQRWDEYTGLCVKSGDSYSVLFNGSSTVLVPKKLSTGKVYTVRGRLERDKGGLKMEIREVKIGGRLRLQTLKGAYWEERGWYVFVNGSKLRLSGPLNATPADVVEIAGLYYNNVFYPVKLISKEKPGEPRDGLPWRLRGVVLSSKRIWNGSESITVYPPYGTHLNPGDLVEVTGIVLMRSRLTVYARTVRKIGTAPEVPMEVSRTGEIGYGRCLVLRGGSRGIRLNCTRLILYGAKARTGDVIDVRALNRGSSMVCLECRLLRNRRDMPNSICEWKKGDLVRIQGEVVWIKIYGNGFGLANVSRSNCSILVKIPSSFDFHPSRGETITVYGTFCLYRGKKAIEPADRNDLCYGRC